PYPDLFQVAQQLVETPGILLEFQNRPLEGLGHRRRHHIRGVPAQGIRSKDLRDTPADLMPIDGRLRVGVQRKDHVAGHLPPYLVRPRRGQVADELARRFTISSSRCDASSRSALPRAVSPPLRRCTSAWPINPAYVTSSASITWMSRLPSSPAALCAATRAKLCPASANWFWYRSPGPPRRACPLWKLVAAAACVLCSATCVSWMARIEGALSRAAASAARSTP